MKKYILCIAALAASMQTFGQQISIPNDQYHYYGPNSTWGGYLQVGGNGRVTNGASVVATNGNLHLDSKPGFGTYINFYSSGNTLLNPQGGNVGIGTDVPSEKLQINGNVVVANTSGWSTIGINAPFLQSSADLIFRASGATSSINPEFHSGQRFEDHGKYSIWRYNGSSHQSSDFVINSIGNIGIGTANPNLKLEVREDGINSQQWYGRVGSSNYSADKQVFLGTYQSKAIIGSHNFALNLWSDLYINTSNGLDGANIILGGKVGIGTQNPAEKLSVNGKIRSHEIKVEVTGWPDYVFEESHKAPSLSELESYIKTNKHLPEIPSAKEVEENGISLGEMNAKLLKKIEEMTMLLIEQNKRMEKQQLEIDQLKSK